MRALLPVLALWASTTAAQDLAVRSGEHEGYTRLVVSTPAGTPWELERTAEGYELILPPEFGFDLSRAFAPIRRDRVADLLPGGPGALWIDLGCDCHARTFFDGPSLVIDVTDGPPPGGVLAEGARAEGPRARPPSAALGPPTALAAEGRAAEVGPADEVAADAAADAARDAVVEGFMRAAALGLLDVAVLLPEEPSAVAPLALPQADPMTADAAPPGPAEPEDSEVAPTPPGPPPDLASAVLAVPEPPAPDAAPPDGAPTDLAPADPAPSASDDMGPSPAASGPAIAPSPSPPAEATAGAAEAALQASPPTEPPAPPPPAGAPPADPLAALAGRPGLSLRTGLEGALADPPAPLAAEGDPCLPPEAFDLAAWAPSGDFGAEVPPRAAALFTERDLWAEGAVEGLARALLAFGFGREAAQALRSDGRASAERDLLLALAALVDGEAAPGALRDQGGCLGPVALWRALARETLEGTGEAERTSMRVALRALPPALRGHLGVRLAGLFLDAGDAGTAEALVDGARGEVTGGGTVAGLAGAAVAEATAGPAAAISDLAALAAEDPRMTPEGVLRLIDLSLAEGRPVDDATLLLAQSLRLDHEADAPALLLAQARGLAAGQRFDEALALLAEEGAILRPAEADAAVDATVAALLTTLGDAEVLDWALGRRPARLPDASLRAVAARLDALGFAPEAEDLLASASGGPAGPPLEGAPTGPAAPPATTPLARPDAAPDATAGGAPAAPPEGGTDAAQPPARLSDALPASTLAERQAMLERAAEARGEAEALLAAPLDG